MCDLESMGVPSLLRSIRSVETLVRILPTFFVAGKLCCKESVNYTTRTVPGCCDLLSFKINMVQTTRLYNLHTISLIRVVSSNVRESG